MKILKPFKILLWFVVLLIVAVFVAGFFADDLAKKGIELGGTHALGVDTTVDSCNVGFFSSTFSLSDLAVANPKGFGNSNFLSMGKGAVEVSAMSLLSDKVEVPVLELSGVRLNLVQGARGSNYGTILDNLERFQGTSDAEKGEGKRFIIKKLTVKDVVVTVVPVKELNLTEVKIPIDPIELTDVGSESDQGVLLSELAGILIESILKRATATGQLPNLVSGVLNGKLGKLTGLADAHVKDLKGLLGGKKLPGGVPSSVDGARKALEKGLKGLGR